MLVPELRKIIEEYNNKDKDKIIIELYKRVPKNIKEEYAIDNFIIDINKKIVKEERFLNIETLEKEINYFIECAYDGLYERPNKIISKNERSKWRFKVIKFYKELNTFLPNTENGIRATELLKKLYLLISYSTNLLTFSNWDTFRAIKVSQSDFLNTIIDRKLKSGINKENIKYCVELLNAYYDPNEYHKSVLYTFTRSMKTTEMKKMAIYLLDEQVKDWNEKYKLLKKERKDTYNAEVYNNYFVECVVDIYFKLKEIDSGIEYFHKNYIKSDKEVKEYIVLNLIEEYDFYEEWVKEYEKHDIDYRDSLRKRYKELKQDY